MDNTEYEVEIKNIRAYDKGCIGCVRHKKDVMIAFDSTNEEYDIKDLFLTQGQAEYLHKELGKVINSNKDEE
jgi:hypothetical protein